MLKNYRSLYCLERIFKNCFWGDYIYKKEDLLVLAKGDARSQKFLFGKIFANSTEPQWDLTILPEEILEKFLSEYSPPVFRGEYLKNRHEMLLYWFGLSNAIPERLKWEK